MNATSARALELLRGAFDMDAEFRDGQLEAVLALVDDRRRVLVVERTGWGKSVVYFLATRLLRDHGFGPTILISPLLSLMRDQLRTAKRLNVEAATINSANADDWDDIEEKLRQDEIDILLVSPERLANERFRSLVAEIPRGIGLFVVDEAHCISDWGHDFRPDYRRIERIVALLPPNVPLLATTATANDRVIADACEQLGDEIALIRGPLARDSLRLQVINLPDQAARLAWLAEHLPQLPGSGIVYTLTVADAERVSRWLIDHGIDTPAYHGQLLSGERQTLEERLLANDVKALVATVALGMGFDKNDLGFVVHYQRPGSVVAYYQQIGRAGRELDDAIVVLLAGVEDDEIIDFFIRGAFPGIDVLTAVAEAISNSGEGLSVRGVEAKVNAPRGRVEQALRLLEVEGAVFKQGPRYVRSVTPWQPDVARMERVTAERRAEQTRMQEFLTTDGCYMEFLARELDDPEARRCGRCANCSGAFLPDAVDPGLTQEAITFLKRGYRPIEPRKQWPAGIDGRRGNIRPELRLEEGRSLSIYNDAGWGKRVAQAKYGDEDFADELVEAVAEMIETNWQPDPAPEWVTAIPSLRRPDLVPGFARRLAERLGLPYRDVLVKARETQPQKSMENSAQQVSNIIEAFEVNAGQVVGEAPVLLFDDIVDSRWSLTVCGVKLREAGSGPVFPVALATASLRS
ncbi:MAG: RecQ family ATP-dependent DNA helicase [Gaiellaceae bacterium]